jgi:hypothetical protein
LTRAAAVNVLGEIRSYEDLHGLLRARANALQISREQLDDIAGFQNGYAGKLMAPRPLRKLGAMSLSCILPALGAKLVLVEDPAALARIGGRLVKRDPAKVRHATAIVVSFTITKRFLRQIGRKGGTNSRKYLPKKIVTELARKAGLAGAAARWKNGG